MVITRFAPSPTGYLHLGNIRTAFFSWLFARKYQGKFYLRIDDTDVVRTKQKYINNILDVLLWLDIKIDEPLIFQSKNLDIYKKFLYFLLDNGMAYKCFCDKDRLDKLKFEQVSKKERIRYDGCCRDFNYDLDKPYVIRFKNILTGSIIIHDIVKGDVKFNNHEFDDFVIAKYDFYPVYNFASVVDDIIINVTHIIRGDDHISNTVKQIKLMQAFKFKLPYFVHLPMILDENKKKLSKRNNVSYVNYYKNNGFLPIALLNYIIRLGWSFGNKEVFSLKEMIKFFDFNCINKSSAAINYKKLLWLNRYYMKSFNTDYLLKYFLPIEKQFKLNYILGPTIKKLIGVYKSRSDTLRCMITDNFFLYTDQIVCDNEGYGIIFSLKYRMLIFKIYNYFKIKKFDWCIDNIKINIKNFLDINMCKMSDISCILRIIITGSNKPCSLYELLFLCGRVLILKKIRNIIKELGAIAQLG